MLRSILYDTSSEHLTKPVEPRALEEVLARFSALRLRRA